MTFLLMSGCAYSWTLRHGLIPERHGQPPGPCEFWTLPFRRIPQERGRKGGSAAVVQC